MCYCFFVLNILYFSQLGIIIKRLKFPLILSIWDTQNIKFLFLRGVLYPIYEELLFGKEMPKYLDYRLVILIFSVIHLINYHVIDKAVMVQIIKTFLFASFLSMYDDIKIKIFLHCLYNIIMIFLQIQNQSLLYNKTDNLVTKK